MSPFRGIRRKLVTLLLLAGVGPLVAFGAAAIASARQSARAMAREANLHIARRAAAEIGEYVAHAQAVLAGVGEILARLRPGPDEQASVLASYKIRFRYFRWLLVVDAAGRRVAASDPGAPAGLERDDPALAAIVQGRAHMGTVVVTENLEPIARVAVPGRRLGQVTLGVVADLDLVGMWRVVDAIQLGETGRVLVLDDDGAVIAHGDPRGKPLVARREKLAGLAAATRQAADHATLVEGRGSLGAPALSVAVPVPGTRWTLVLEQQAREAFARARRLTWLLAALVLGAAAGMVALGVRQARRAVLRPVQRLKEAAAAFAGRRFDHRAQVATGDELEELAGALNDMAGALARADAELARSERVRVYGTIAAGLAHDLKHPVGALEAVLARAGGRSLGDLPPALQEIPRREVGKLAAIVERLRDLGRTGELRAIDFPAEEIARASGSFQLAANEKGVTLEVEPVDPALRVRGDATLLARAVDNLLSNALAASATGGRVALAIAAAGGRDVEIAVSDGGPGIPALVRERLCEGLAPGSSTGGLGLGLLVVQRVAEAHGGRMVLAAPGQASRVALILPIRVGA